MPEQGVVIEGDLGVERVQGAFFGEKERVDFYERGVELNAAR